jgi:hypothetical protein
LGPPRVNANLFIFVLKGNDDPFAPDLSGLLAALIWEHPRKKTPDPRKWASQVVAYPVEIEGIIPAVKTRRRNRLSPEVESICGEIAALSVQWARCVKFELLSYEEAYQRSDHQPWLENWTTLAQNTMLSSHAPILEDGPELPKAQRQEHSDEG